MSTHHLSIPKFCYTALFLNEFNQIRFLQFKRRASMRKNNSIVCSEMDKSISDFSKSILFTQADSLQFISDSPTTISQVDFMEENRESRNSQDLDSSFKKELVQSCYESKFNPNAKKSKILVVESRILPAIKPPQREEDLCKEEAELQSIERKTQDLVLRQKQQRKELKQLKKLYMEKMGELAQQSEAHQLQNTSLNSQINGLLHQKTQLLKEKEAIQQNMIQLQKEVEKTQQEIKNSNEQRQHLIRQIEQYEVNFQPATHQNNPSDENTNSATTDFDRQIRIINRLIDQHKKEGSHAEVRRLLQLKIELLEKRQVSKIKEETIKHQRIITQLNEIISSRNNLIRSKNNSIYQMENHSHEQNKDQFSKFKEQAETAESFFSKQSANYLQGKQQVEGEALALKQAQQWDQFKISVRKLISSNRISGHEQAYETIEAIVLGMIHLFENKICCEEDVLELLDISLETLNNQYTTKARARVCKIEQLLKFSTKANKNITHNQKENFYQYAKLK